MPNLVSLTAILILDACYIKLTFSLIVTFYRTKPENRTKKSLTQLVLLLLVKVLSLPKNTDILYKKR